MWNFIKTASKGTLCLNIDYIALLKKNKLHSEYIYLYYTELDKIIHISEIKVVCNVYFYFKKPKHHCIYNTYLLYYKLMPQFPNFFKSCTPSNIQPPAVYSLCHHSWPNHI